MPASENVSVHTMSFMICRYYTHRIRYAQHTMVPSPYSMCVYVHCRYASAYIQSSASSFAVRKHQNERKKILFHHLIRMWQNQQLAWLHICPFFTLWLRFFFAVVRVLIATHRTVHQQTFYGLMSIYAKRQRLVRRLNATNDEDGKFEKTI